MTDNRPRTTFTIGEQERSGTSCSNCGMTYLACNRNIARFGRSCCGPCNDSHHDVEVVESPPAPTTPTPEFHEVRSNANPVVHRTSDEGSQPTTICGVTLPYLVRDPRRWNGYPRRDITDCQTCFPNVVVIDNPVMECTVRSGHVSYPHTHTTDPDPLWGRPGGTPTSPRVLNPDGTETIFAKGQHLTVPNTDSSESTTTERESTMPPTPDVPGDIGDDIYPLNAAKLRGLPNGSVLTIRSRDRGEPRANRIAFGCQEWDYSALAAAHATVEYQQNNRAVVTCDVATSSQQNTFLTIAGRSINLPDVNEYARSITIKELGATDPANALVMEHGFYGCLHHRGEVLILGMGMPRPHGTTQVPLMGRLRQHGAPDAAYGGTVGVPIGLLHASSTQCTPAWPVTGAHTMMFATERRFSAVPASPAQIERADDRFEVATIPGRDIVMCDEHGVVEAPALADMPF